MTKENSNSQNPEEMAKAAQEAAVKAAMEQAQAMFGNIPGFQMPGGMAGTDYGTDGRRDARYGCCTGTTGSHAESSRHKP